MSAGDPEMQSPSGSRVFGLDLVRAMAVLLVLNTHLASIGGQVGQVWPGRALGSGPADIGVQLFFVLSGFLIGGILLDIFEREPTEAAWRRFLARRWLRTLPLYYFWLAVVLAVSLPSLETVIKYLLFLQNFAWPMPRWSAFNVSWTLSIEEWFYILFSGIFLRLALTRPRHALAIACALFIVVPLLLRLGLGPLKGDLEKGMRKIVVFRLDAIAYGVVLIWCCRRFPSVARRWRWWLASLGVVAVAAIDYVHDLPPADHPWHAFKHSLVPIALAFFFPAAIHLKRPPIHIERLIGWWATRSYPIYIVHLDLMQWTASASRGEGLIPATLFFPVSVGATVLVAELCHRFVERPFMRRRPRQFRDETPAAAPAMA